MLALPAFVAVACFVAHAAVNRFVLPGHSQASPQRVALMVALAAAAACTAAVAWRFGIGELPFAAVVSGCVAYCYFHLFNMSETARRIRIITSCHLGLPIDDLTYSVDDMIDLRIERLRQFGSLRREGECYAPVPGPLLAVVGVLDWWRGLLFPTRVDPAGAARTTEEKT